MSLGTNSFSYTNLRDSIEVGNYSSIASDCYFHEVNDQHLCVSNKECVYSTNWDQPTDNKEIVIGNDVWIGHGAKIFSNITIGDGAIIGAHAVVTKDVPPFAVVTGNPGKVRRYRFTKSQIEKLRQVKWWNMPDMKEKREDLKDIDKFLEEYA